MLQGVPQVGNYASTAAIERSASALASIMRHRTGFKTCGIGKYGGKDTIFVYVKGRKTKAGRDSPDTWGGYPVVLRVVGEIRPAVG